MKFKTTATLVFDLGGNGTVGGGSGAFTLPAWVYSSTPINIVVSQSVIITPTQ